MPPLDVRTVGDQVIAAVKSHTEREVGPVRAKLAALESNVASLPTADFVRAEVAGAKSSIALDLLGALSKSTDGKTITVEDVKPLVESLVSAIPAPKDGADGKDGRDGVDGKSVEPAEVKAMVDETVTRAAANLLAAQPVIDDEMKAFADAIAMRFTAAAIA